MENMFRIHNIFNTRPYMRVGGGGLGGLDPPESEIP